MFKSIIRARHFSTTAFLKNSLVAAVTANSTSSSNIAKSLDLSPLKFEQNLYATVNIHNRPYLITEGDEVILPFRMKQAEVGDIIEFDNVTTLGSRNYTLHKDDGSIDQFVSIKGVVLEKTKKPMVVKEVTKRRNRHTKHTNIKHDLTMVRISELKLKY